MTNTLKRIFSAECGGTANSRPAGFLFRRLKDARRRTYILHTRESALKVLRSYVEANNLRDGASGQITIDPHLADAFFVDAQARKSGGGVPTKASQKQLGKLLMKKLEPFYTVTRSRAEMNWRRVDALSSSMAGEEWHQLPAATQGRVVKVKIWTERNRRRKDKYVTHVQNLKPLGVDVEALADGGSRIFACAASARRDPSKPQHLQDMELLVHGNCGEAVKNFLTRALPDGLGLPGSIIQLVKKVRQ